MFVTLSETHVAMLAAKAEQLAAAELEKLAAAEARYRDTVQFHQYHMHPVNPNSGVYCKNYYDITGSTVKDIYRSESVLRPITIEIEFTYDYYATPRHHSDLPNVRERAQADTEFELINSGSVTRRYPCNLYGDYDGSLPERLPEINLFGGQRTVPPDPAEPLPNPFPPA